MSRRIQSTIKTIFVAVLAVFALMVSNAFAQKFGGGFNDELQALEDRAYEITPGWYNYAFGTGQGGGPFHHFTRS